MCEKEKMYIEMFENEYLILSQACKIWRKPGYSSLSKVLPKMGYETAVKNGIIPKYKKEGTAYLFRISDILDFLDSKEVENGEN